MTKRRVSRQRSWVRWPHSPFHFQYWAAQTHYSSATMWPRTVNSIIASQRKRRN